MKTINRDELKEMLNKKEDFELINVLSEEHFRKAHIPGSSNVPLTDENFLQKIEQQAGSKNKKIVVYCASFDCDASPKAAKRLEQAGFTDVYDFEGGQKNWQDGGYAVERAS